MMFLLIKKMAEPTRGFTKKSHNESWLFMIQVPNKIDGVLTIIIFIIVMFHTCTVSTSLHSIMSMLVFKYIFFV